MKIQHHSDDSTLMSFAAGTLAEPLAAVISTHVAMCPHCQGELRLMEQLGFACLRELPDEGLVGPTPVTRLAKPAVAAAATKPSAVVASKSDVPPTLRHLVGDSIEDIAWKRLGPGVWHKPLPLSAGTDGDLRLLKVAAGQAMPEHGHGGTELTLILRGAYVDRFGRYAVGDIADLDEDAEHRPLVEAAEACICLVASERKARFKGLASRLVQPLTGM